ncbi:hypothetical protein LguiA_014591 [Lonicera macranthoides]
MEFISHTQLKAQQATEDYLQWRNSKVEEGARENQPVIREVCGKGWIKEKSTASISSEESIEGGTKGTRQAHVDKNLADMDSGKVLIDNSSTCSSMKRNEMFVSNVVGDENYSNLEGNNSRAANVEGNGPLYGKQGPSAWGYKDMGLSAERSELKNWSPNYLSSLGLVKNKQIYFVTEPAEGESENESCGRPDELMQPLQIIRSRSKIKTRDPDQGLFASPQTESTLASDFFQLSIRKRNSADICSERGGKIRRGEEGKLKLYDDEDSNQLGSSLMELEVLRDCVTGLPQRTTTHRRRKWKLDARKSTTGREIAVSKGRQDEGKVQASVEKSSKNWSRRFSSSSGRQSNDRRKMPLAGRIRRFRPPNRQTRSTNSYPQFLTPKET